MARGCSACNHPRLKEINAELLKSEEERMSYREIVLEFDLPSKSCVSVHRNEHLPRIALQETLAVPEEERAIGSESVYEDIIKLKDALMRAVERAEEEGDDRGLREAIKAAVPLYNLAARLAGLLEDRLRIQVDVSNSEEFKYLLQVIFTALENHPEAREHVLKALEVADPYRTAALPPAAKQLDYIDVEPEDEDEP